jgi:hypothetical protein
MDGCGRLISGVLLSSTLYVSLPLPPFGLSLTGHLAIKRRERVRCEPCFICIDSWFIVNSDEDLRGAMDYGKYFLVHCGRGR